MKKLITAFALLIFLQSCKVQSEIDYYNLPCRIMSIDTLKDGRYRVTVRHKISFYERPFTVLPDTFSVGKLIIFQTFKRIK